MRRRNRNVSVRMTEDEYAAFMMRVQNLVRHSSHLLSMPYWERRFLAGKK